MANLMLWEWQFYELDWLFFIFILIDNKKANQ